jgi:hypothetical protein
MKFNMNKTMNRTMTKSLASAALILGMMISGVSRASTTASYLLTPPGVERSASLDDGWDCLNELFDGKTCQICVVESNEKAAREQIQTAVDMWQLNYYGKSPSQVPAENPIRLAPITDAGDGKFCTIATGTVILATPPAK